MNIAIITAGGTGSRMGNTDKPKQFMDIAGKPIIIHTLKKFENCDEIDGIIIASLEEWIPYLNDLIREYGITKVKKVVPGGETGQMSIFSALNAAHEEYPEDSIIIVNDGVRPFITDELIKENIKTVKEKGSAISCVPLTETLILVDDNNEVLDMPKRDLSLSAKAPQSFYLKELYETHLKAQLEGLISMTDSSTLMHHYGKKLTVVMTDYDNIKITTQKDIALGESIYARRLNEA